MPVMSSNTPPNATDSPSVVRPPPQTVTGTRYCCAAFSRSATCSLLRAMTTAVRQPVGGAAGIGGEGAARRSRFEQLDAACAERNGKLFPARTGPARRVGLLALDPLQGVGRDRAGADGAGLNYWYLQAGSAVRKTQPFELTVRAVAPPLGWHPFGLIARAVAPKLRWHPFGLIARAAAIWSKPARPGSWCRSAGPARPATAGGRTGR